MQFKKFKDGVAFTKITILQKNKLQKLSKKYIKQLF
jgi:hypothetical protein